MAPELADRQHTATRPAALDIVVQGDRPNTRLTVEGEIDMASVDSLRAMLDWAFAAPCESVTVDLSGVTFMDSCGLKTLVDAHHTATTTGRTFGVVNPSGIVARVLDLGGLDFLLAE